MTERLYYIGSSGPFYYDDADVVGAEGGTLDGENLQALLAEGSIKVSVSGADADHVLRRADIEAGISAVISDTAYGVGWNGVTTIAPSKNAVYDKIETSLASVLANVVEDVTPQLGGDLDMNTFGLIETVASGTGSASLIDFKLGTAGAKLTSGDHPIIIDHHANGQGASLSYAVYIKTSTDVLDKGAGLVVENYGFADGGTFAINTNNSNQSVSALAAFNNSTTDVADQYNLTMKNTHGYNIINQSKGTGSSLHIRRNGNVAGTLKSGAHIMIDERSSGDYGHLTGLKMNTHANNAQTDRQIVLQWNSVERYRVDVNGKTAITGGGIVVNQYETLNTAIEGNTTQDSANNYGIKGAATGNGTNNIAIYAHAANGSGANYGFQDSFGNYSNAGAWRDSSDPTRKTLIRKLTKGEPETLYALLDEIEVKNYRYKAEIPIIGYDKTKKEIEDEIRAEASGKELSEEEMKHETKNRMSKRIPIKDVPEKAPERYGVMGNELPDFLSSKNKDSVSGSQLATYLIVIVQHQKKLIEDLTARVEALEAK